MLYRKKIEPRCVYCEKGYAMNDDQVVCARKGLVEASGHCGAFKYDPLKRVPPRPTIFNADKLSAEDFEL